MFHLIAILAVWRITSMFFQEDGPFSIFAIIRREANKITRVFKCFWCLSVWVAIPFATFTSHSIFEFLITWLGYSAGAILINEYLEARDVR
jgi:hypothetical protein